MRLCKTLTSTPASIALVLARLIGGGAFVLAAIMKLKGGAKVFAMSIDSFHMLPEALLLPVAYYLPWLELAAGIALILGVWSRQAAAICAGLYIAFTIGLVSVLLRGLDVDCGCFGDLFGPGVVGWTTVLRNVVLSTITASVVVYGAGRFALTQEREPIEPPSHPDT